MSSTRISDGKDPDARRQLQLERLQSTLNRAVKNVPFHRNRLREGEELGAESFKAFSHIPFMERRHLGQHYPYGLFAVPLRDIVRIHTAPGTAINPTVSGYTKQDLSIWRESVANALTAAGVTPHDILQICLDSGLANWGRDYKDAAEAIEAGVIPNTPLSIEKQVMVLRDYKTSVLITTPAIAAQLIDHIFDIDLNPTSLNIRTLILVGEAPDTEARSRMAARLHVSTWLHYGLSEIPGPAIAFECGQHEGLHVNIDHFLPEIVDPATGESLPDGEPGELVITTLTARAFPLIRFRTGDRARLIPGECRCGSDHLRMEWFGTRTDDLFSIDGVKVSHDQIGSYISGSLGESPDFTHAVRQGEGNRPCLEVRVVVDDTLFSDEIKMLEAVVQNTERMLRENLGVPVQVRLRESSGEKPAG